MRGPIPGVGRLFLEHVGAVEHGLVIPGACWFGGAPGQDVPRCKNKLTSSYKCGGALRYQPVRLARQSSSTTMGPFLCRVLNHHDLPLGGILVTLFRPNQHPMTAETCADGFVGSWHRLHVNQAQPHFVEADEFPEFVLIFDVPYPMPISPIHVNVRLASMRDCALILQLNGISSYRIQYISLSSSDFDGNEQP